jgi:hypothetical protein
MLPQQTCRYRPTGPDRFVHPALLRTGVHSLE